MLIYYRLLLFLLLVACLLFIIVLFFFFKQKTAYEMRISDWSSDVCSSDLQFGRQAGQRVDVFGNDLFGRRMGDFFDVHAAFARSDDGDLLRGAEIGRASCRERVCQYV